MDANQEAAISSALTDECLDCHTTETVCMYNRREVRGGFLWLQTVTRSFPGFLCIPCWKLANPRLFPKIKR